MLTALYVTKEKRVKKEHFERNSEHEHDFDLNAHPTTTEIGVVRDSLHFVESLAGGELAECEHGNDFFGHS